jgi:predicted dehydrogenase
METKTRVRYAVVGIGNIAQVAILPAFAHAKQSSELVALVSGDPEKRAELSERYELSLAGDYDDLEKILEQGDVQAVYLATPNSLHKDLALRAAARGVHVLCEKPLTTSVADCEEVVDACDKANVKLMCAYRLHFEEANLSAMEIAQSGKLGEARIFESVFTHVVRPGDIRTRPELGGGACFDLGIYCVNAARNLFRAEPVLVYGTAQMRDGTDDTTTAILQFPGGRVAHFTVSNSVASVSSYRIAGTEGDLRVEPAYDYTEKLQHHLTIGGKTSSRTFGKRDQFAPELEHFSDCILENRTPEPDGEEAIDDLRVIEAILESAASGKPIPLTPRQRRRRPSARLESKKPAVGEQETVNAPSPSLR